MSKNINLTSLVGQDFVNTISSLPLGRGEKDGHEYFYLDLVFVNGYSKRVFLNHDSLFGVKDALKDE